MASVNSMVDGKTECPTTVFIAITLSWLIIVWRPLKISATFSLHSRSERGFRAFLNKPVGGAYFNNNNDKEENTVQELSKLIKRCFLVRTVGLLWQLAYVVRLA